MINFIFIFIAFIFFSRLITFSYFQFLCSFGPLIENFKNMNYLFIC